MAKLGESDARWIVADRHDGKNVNAWHWEERDLSKVTHDNIKEQLKNKIIIAAADDGKVTNMKVVEVSEIDGDVTLAQRKGKIMCYFEIKLTIKWSATVKKDGSSEGGSEEVTGKFILPEVDHDSFNDDFVINVNTTESDESSQIAAKVAQKQGREFIREFIINYFNTMFKENKVGAKAGSGSTLPPMQTTTTNNNNTTTNNNNNTTTNNNNNNNNNNNGPTSFNWKMNWHCSLSDIYTAFTNEQYISAYTRSNTKIDARPTGQFEFLNGAITGYYVDIDNNNNNNKKISMQWRLSSWAPGHFATVIMDFIKDEEGLTRLEFAMAGIPNNNNNEVERVKQGWIANFIDSIKTMMGYRVEWL